MPDPAALTLTKASVTRVYRVDVPDFLAALGLPAAESGTRVSVALDQPAISALEITVTASQ